MNLAASDVKIDAVVGDEVPEALGDSPKADGRLTVVRLLHGTGHGTGSDPVERQIRRAPE